MRLTPSADDMLFSLVKISIRHSARQTAKMGDRRKRAFTLIELLVVIAIIAILAALIFPSIGVARRSAQRGACVSNLRGVGTAITLYVGDHTGLLPGPSFEIIPPQYRTSPPYLALGYYLAPYLGMRSDVGGTYTLIPAMVCPAFKALMQPGNAATFMSLVEYARIKTYVDSSTQLTFDPLQSGVPAHALSGITSVTRAVSLRQVCVMGEVDQLNKPGVPSISTALPSKPVHGMARNYLYFDAHVDSVALANDIFKASGQ